MRLVLSAVLLSGGCATGARAGVVALDFSELAWLLASGLGQAAVVVGCGEHAVAQDCVRSRALSVNFARGAEIQGRPSSAILQAPPSFAALGGRYALIPMEPVVLDIGGVTKDQGLTITVDTVRAPRFHVVCVKGACADDGVLPQVVWHDAGLRVVLARATAEDGGGGSGTAGTGVLEIGAIRASGSLSLECIAQGGIGAVICTAARSLLQPHLSGLLRSGLEDWRRSTNAEGLDRVLARLLAPVAADVGVRGLRADARGVRLSFCFASSCP